MTQASSFDHSYRPSLEVRENMVWIIHLLNMNYRPPCLALLLKTRPFSIIHHAIQQLSLCIPTSFQFIRTFRKLSMRIAITKDFRSRNTSWFNYEDNLFQWPLKSKTIHLLLSHCAISPINKYALTESSVIIPVNCLVNNRCWSIIGCLHYHVINSEWWIHSNHSKLYYKHNNSVLVPVCDVWHELVPSHFFGIVCYKLNNSKVFLLCVLVRVVSGEQEKWMKTSLFVLTIDPSYQLFVSWLFVVRSDSFCGGSTTCKHKELSGAAETGLEIESANIFSGFERLLICK